MDGWKHCGFWRHCGFFGGFFLNHNQHLPNLQQFFTLHVIIIHHTLWRAWKGRDSLRTRRRHESFSCVTAEDILLKRGCVHRSIPFKTHVHSCECKRLNTEAPHVNFFLKKGKGGDSTPTTSSIIWSTILKFVEHHRAADYGRLDPSSSKSR